MRDAFSSQETNSVRGHTGEQPMPPCTAGSRGQRDRVRAAPPGSRTLLVHEDAKDGKPDSVVAGEVTLVRG